MNKDSVLEALLMYLSSFSYHDTLLAELVELLSGSGQEARFFRQITARLYALSVRGVQACTLDGFENIGQGLYSMRLLGNGYNIRVLYSFMPNGRPVLLLAFYERGGKFKTSYAPHIPPALSRLGQIKEEFDYEQ